MQEKLNKREFKKWDDFDELIEFINSGAWATVPFVVIDTNPNQGEHTWLCSCPECVEIKKLLFSETSEEYKKQHRDQIPMLAKVLENDGIW